MIKKIIRDGEEYYQIAGPYDPKDPAELSAMQNVLKDQRLRNCKCFDVLDESCHQHFVYRHSKGWLTTDYKRKSTKCMTCPRCGATKEPRPCDGYPICKKCRSDRRRERYNRENGTVRPYRREI